MFNNYNLLDLMATDYGDYARKILRIVFSRDELKSSILSSGKPHFLDVSHLIKIASKFEWVCIFFSSFFGLESFRSLIDPMWYKFKLDVVNFGLFYQALLRRKLTDFLIEERRHEPTKEAR
ncbi:unnamed protein product [Rotaria socialis]|uniref:Uncharacterized protein n=1 Tax=Rotaria socialis TaxID=392032 RepID=A0A817QAI1_9BILA|nr:unnamed protein product [Rotaria socialis]